MTAAPQSSITIRPADQADAASLRRLAELDSTRIPVGEVWLAEVDGKALAALAPASGTVVADPFHHTLHLVELLELAADGRQGRPSASRLHRRFRARPAVGTPRLARA